MKIKLNIKNVLVLSILSVILTSISLFFMNTSFAANTAKITVETANLREKPDANAKILDLINRGENVEIIETSGEWNKVKYKNIMGYLRNDLLAIENKTEKNTTENKTTSNTSTENTATNNTTATNGITTNNDNSNTVNENTKPVENTEDKAEENKIDENNAQNQETEKPEETVKEQEEVKGKYKLVVDTTLKVIPLIHSIDITDINKDTEVEVVNTMNYWAYVTIGDKQGWVILEKMQKIEEPVKEQTEKQETTQEQPNNEEKQPEQQGNTEQKPEEAQKENTQTQATKTKYTNSNTVNVRANADRNSNLVIQIPVNTEVKVISEENGWSKVTVADKQGYILSSLLSDRKQETSRGMQQSRTATSNATTNKTTTSTNNNNLISSINMSNREDTGVANSSNVAPSNTSTGASIVEYAKQFIGVRYTYGGSSPSTGFDCSGFTSYVYRNFGISLPRTAGAQSRVGTPVSRANLAPGDLVFYSGHVAIYVGGGNVIHAPRPGKSICIVPLNQASNSGFIGARRVV